MVIIAHKAIREFAAIHPNLLGLSVHTKPTI